mgnify:FL=1
MNHFISLLVYSTSLSLPIEYRMVNGWHDLYPVFDCNLYDVDGYAALLVDLEHIGIFVTGLPGHVWGRNCGSLNIWRRNSHLEYVTALFFCRKCWMNWGSAPI